LLSLGSLHPPKLAPGPVMARFGHMWMEELESMHRPVSMTVVHPLQAIFDSELARFERLGQSAIAVGMFKSLLASPEHLPPGILDHEG